MDYVLMSDILMLLRLSKGANLPQSEFSAFRLSKLYQPRLRKENTSPKTKMTLKYMPSAIIIALNIELVLKTKSQILHTAHIISNLLGRCLTNNSIVASTNQI